MSERERPGGPAHRFLHVCYSCDDADAVADTLTGAVGLRAVMRTPPVAASGALLGLDRTITTSATFVFDARGRGSARRSRSSSGSIPR